MGQTSLRCFQAPCVFQNMLDLVAVDTNKYFEKKKFATREAFALKMPVRCYAQCAQHSTACPVPWDDFVCGGSPCIDHSSIGQRAGRMGKSSILLHSWARLVVVTDPVVALHENVGRFDDEMLVNAVKETHEAYRIEADTSCVGFGRQIRRSRVYHILVSKKRARLAAGPAR